MPTLSSAGQDSLHLAPFGDERSDLTGMRLMGERGATYVVGRSLGVGATGVVHQVEGNDLILKTLRRRHGTEPELAERLVREGQVTLGFQHAGLPHGVDSGVLLDGSPFVVLTHVPGVSLGQVLAAHGALTGPEIAILAIRAAAVLHVVHQQGVVHRDIKPEHLLLSSTDSGRLRVGLIDFGVCTGSFVTAQQRQDETGRVYGTPNYVSPEQARGVADVDARADLYGLGAVLYECASGQVPFRASNVARLLRKIISCEVPGLRGGIHGVGPAVERCILGAITRDAEHRYSSARGLSRSFSDCFQSSGEKRSAETLLLERIHGADVLGFSAPTPHVALEAVG